MYSAVLARFCGVHPILVRSGAERVRVRVRVPWSPVVRRMPGPGMRKTCTRREAGVQVFVTAEISG